MAKLKLNPNPTFNRKLTFTADGSEEEINLKCRHKSRTEFNELWDEHRAAQPKPPDDAPDDIDIRKTIDWQVDLFMQLVDGWDIEAEFNRDNVRALLNNYFDFYGSFVESYTKGLMRAKLGN